MKWTAYRKFIELIFEKQNVFGTTAYSDHNSDCKSYQNGQNLKMKIKISELSEHVLAWLECSSTAFGNTQ